MAIDGLGDIWILPLRHLKDFGLIVFEQIGQHIGEVLNNRVAFVIKYNSNSHVSWSVVRLGVL